MGAVLSIVMPFEDRGDVQIALDALTLIDVYELRKHGRHIPGIYESGVRYQRERCLAPGLAGRETCERFLSIRKGLVEKLLDCDDLAPWRTAELIVRGGEPTARAIAQPSAVGFHCVVRRASGLIEDPSLRLGMRVAG